MVFEYPELARILDASVDITATPVTLRESIYINILFQHVSSAYEALKDGLSVRPEGLCEDVRSFFSLPIPKTVWEKSKPLLNKDFVAFIQSCLNSPLPKES